MKINVIWLCAYNIKKCIYDIEKLYSIKKKIDKKISLNLIILDRRREGLEFDLYQKYFKGGYFTVYSSRDRSHQQDYYYLTKNFNSNFTLSLTDDDKIHHESLIDYLNLLKHNNNEKIVLAICKNWDKNAKNKLVPNRLYDYWEYQLKRGPNLAYYSAIASDSLFLTCGKHIEYKSKIWIHPMHDQCFIWSILNRGKYKIKTVEGSYMSYDNSNWFSRKKSLATFKNYQLKYNIKEPLEKLAFRDVLITYSNDKIDFQIFIWLFYLVYRNLRYYRNPFRSFYCLFNLLFFMILKK